MLGKILSPLSGPIYAVLRIVVGLLFLLHGLGKVFGFLSDHQPPMMSQIWIGGLIELVTGALIAVGFFTRPAAFIASGQMAVAYFQFHWKFQLDQSFSPLVNGGELAVIYCLVMLYIAARGPGPWSVSGG